MIRPPSIDPRRVQPVVQLFAHVAAESLDRAHGTVRLEDVGPLTLGAFRRYLGRGNVTVKLTPVIDLNDTPPPADAYEIPVRTREHVRLLMPASLFPFRNSTSRRNDLDHCEPWRPGSKGLTRVDNLGPLDRPAHRVKTYGGWQSRQPEPTIRVWRTPLGEHYLVSPTGSQPLGNSTFAQRLWDAAAR